MRIGMRKLRGKLRGVFYEVHCWKSVYCKLKFWKRYVVSMRSLKVYILLGFRLIYFNMR